MLKICINCGSDKLSSEYVKWTTNGTTVKKLKCQKCGEIMWTTNLSQEEVLEALEKIEVPLKESKQLEFNF